MPAVELIETTVPDALLAHHGQHRARHVHRPDQVRDQLPLDLLGRQLLEEAGVEVAGVVDEHVDAAEALERCPHCRLRGREAGDVELDDQQVVGLAERVTDRLGVAAGRDDRVAGGERGPGDVHAHAAAGAGDEPDLLTTHPHTPFLLIRPRRCRRGLLLRPRKHGCAGGESPC